MDLDSGLKKTKEKAAIFVGKSTVSMAMFNSELLDCQRVCLLLCVVCLHY